MIRSQSYNNDNAANSTTCAHGSRILYYSHNCSYDDDDKNINNNDNDFVKRRAQRLLSPARPSPESDEWWSVTAVRTGMMHICH